MSLLHSQSFKSLLYPFLFFPFPSPQIPTFFTPKPPTLKNPRNPNSTILYCTNSQRPTVPTTEQQVLEAIASSDEKTLPCVRTYEDDAARLSLVGAVEFEQALTAAAADGGEAARQHVDSGVPTMVVETVFPGSGGDHSTVSTRLFLPANRVTEKASRLRKSFSENMLNSTTSKNILAMTFRQVVLQQLWSFQLVSFVPGTERNMEDLESPREVTAAFTLSSSNDLAISMLAEAICNLSLQSIKENFMHGLSGRSSKSSFSWFRKIRKFSSRDSSVVVHQLSEDEVLQNAETMLQSFSSSNGFHKHFKSLPKNFDWTPTLWSKLESIAGPEFSEWVREYVPTYKLQVDASYLEDLKFEGWRKLVDNRWEVLLTNSQMVGLANILDMFYEDIYTLPWKELPCHMVANPSTLSSKKWSSSLLRMLSIALASGIFFVAIRAFSQVSLPDLKKEGKHHLDFKSVPSSEVGFALEDVLDHAKIQELCSSVVRKIKDALSWADDIIIDADIGSWVGELPSYLRNSSEANSYAASSAPTETDGKLSLQDIASYQVVLSTDGKIVGFQPMSRVAVNHWAASPLAKELYGGRKLSPGLIEPRLKIQRPNKIVVLELLVSVNADASFALVRPVR